MYFYPVFVLFFPAQGNVSNVKLLSVSEASLSDQSACCLEKSLKRVGRKKKENKKRWAPQSCAQRHGPTTVYR